MLIDYPLAFRRRVLRRVAERDDLDATAREFGIPPDLVFRWLKEEAEAAPPRAAVAPVRLPRPSIPAGRREADPWIYLCVYGLLLPPMLLLGVVGTLHQSVQLRRDGLPVWIGLWGVLFAVSLRTIYRRLDDREVDVSTAARLGIAVLCAVLCGVCTVTLAIGLPTIPHRFVATPLEVRTVVSDKSSYHGRHGPSYWLSTPVFDERLGAFNWGADRGTFDSARIGETIVLHGTVSWFGFKQKSFELLPGEPVATPAVSAVRAPVHRAVTVRATTPVPQQASVPPPPMPRPIVAVASPVTPAAPPVTPVEAPSGVSTDPLRVRPGDGLAALRAAYPDAPAPAPYHAVTPVDRQMVRLPARGLWFFLDAGGAVNVVRIDPPFAAAVDGVRLGDALDDVRRVLGAPGRDISHGPPGMSAVVRTGSVLFDTPTGYRLRVDLDAADRVRTIFLVR